MNVFAITNVTTMQQRRCYVDILMIIFSIMNVIITQRRVCYVGISMNVFYNINSLTTQLGTSCSFDSPGLARNEPTPSEHPQGDSTP